MKVWPALAAALFAPVAPSAIIAQTPTALADLPGVTIDYYDVTGNDASTIRASIDKLRPTDINDGEPVDALTSTWWKWSWRGGRGGCDLATVTLDFTATVRLPRLIGAAALPAPLRDAWRHYVAALERHEAGHVRNGQEARPAILAAIKAATCATAGDAARRAIAAAVLRDTGYDRVTKHGATEGASFPAVAVPPTPDR